MRASAFASVLASLSAAPRAAEAPLNELHLPPGFHVLVMPDCALLVSDDLAGAIYRITYTKS